MDSVSRLSLPARTSSLACGIGGQQLPSFKHLLQLSEQSGTSQDNRSAFGLLPVPVLAPAGDDHKNHVDCDYKAFNHRHVSCSICDYELPLASSFRDTRSNFDTFLSASARRVAKRKHSETESLFPVLENEHVNSGGNKVCKIREHSTTRYCLPSPTNVALDSRTPLPSSKQIKTSMNRSVPVRVAPDECTIDSRSRKSKEGVDGAHETLQHNQAESCTESRMPLRLLISGLLAEDKSSHITETRPGLLASIVIPEDQEPSRILKTALIQPHSDLIDVPNVEYTVDKSQQAVLLPRVSTERFSLEKDPAEIDASLTRRYLHIFFNLTNISVFDLLPRTYFIEWAMNCTRKSVTGKVMLYALMSWASLDCPSSVSSHHRAVFKVIVYEGSTILKQHCCLESVHALLFLAFAEYGDHEYGAGSTAFAKCVDMMFLLHLNIEQVWKTSVRAYDFSTIMDAECRRRTFWTVFCLDTHMQLHHPSLSDMSGGKIGVRLPCDDISYDQEWLAQQPCSRTDRGFETFASSDVAHMIQITRIFVDIVSHTTGPHCESISLPRYSNGLSYRRQLKVRLKDWTSRYSNASSATNSNLHWVSDGVSNLRQSESHTWTSPCLDMLYHSSLMKINRWIYHRGITDIDLSAHAKDATMHALAILGLAEKVMTQGELWKRNYVFVSRSFSTVTAIFEAIDIITAIGRVADILEPGSRIMALMYRALELLTYLGSWWNYDLVKYKEVEQRIQSVFRSAESALIVNKVYFYCSNSIGNAANKDRDLIYGTNRRRYIRLAYSDCHGVENDDIYRVETY